MTKSQDGEATAYNQWLAAEIQEAIDDPQKFRGRVHRHPGTPRE